MAIPLCFGPGTMATTQRLAGSGNSESRVCSYRLPRQRNREDQQPDMAKAIEDESVFLEVNPRGHWYGVEQQTKPLLAALVWVVIAGGSRAGASR
jgi:hypothetical protein